jgi:outer membrane protein assembly factor BamB
MQLTRRGFLELATAVAGTGLLAACQAAATQTAATAPAATAAAAGQAPIATVLTAPTAVSAAPTTAASGAAAAPSPTPAAAAATTGQTTPSAAGAAVRPVAGKPMYQQDAQHTGRSPHAGPRQLPRLRRSFDTSLPANMPSDPATPRADFQSSSVVGPDGTIYVANFPGTLFALKDSPSVSDTLDVAWRFHPPAASSFHATPALSPDGATVYLGYAGGGAAAPKATLYALQAPSSSGGEPRTLWTADLGAVRVMASPTVGPDGTIYIGTAGGQLFAIGSDGTPRWSAPTGPAIKSAPALAKDGTVYLPSADGKLYAVSPQGQVRWSFVFAEHLGSTPLVTSDAAGPGGAAGGGNGIGSGASPTVGPDGTVFIGANNSNLYAVTPDGRQKWLFEAERELAGIWTTPALSADGATLYFGANKGGLYAINADSGTRRWQFPIYGSIYASSALDSAGILYTGTTIEHVYAVNAASGEQLWDFDAHNQVWSAPSIRPDGTLVIADRSGLVQVLG